VLGRAAGCAILLPESSDRDMIPDVQAGQAGEESTAREQVSVASGWLRVTSVDVGCLQGIRTEVDCGSDVLAGHGSALGGL
jgi:hypothetical protein